MQLVQGEEVIGGHKPAAPKCNLGRLIPESMDKEEVKRDGWNSHRILVVQADDSRLSWIERQIIEQLGKRLYAQR